MTFFLRSLLPGFLAIAAFSCPVRAELPVSVAPDDPLLVYSGRRDDSRAGEVRLGYSGSRVRMAFEGGALGMRMDAAKPNWVNVYIDGKRTEKLKVEGAGSYYDLAKDLPPGLHTVEIVKATEGMVGPVVFRGFALPEGGKAAVWPEKQTRRIEFIGDSITCGYGIEVEDPKVHFAPETENFCDTYAWLAARALNADYLVVARSGIGMLRNYGGPTDGNLDNMPAIYDRTLFHEPGLTWEPGRFTPDVVCINLGTNDFSTSGVNQEKFAANYEAFAKMLIGRYPSARLVFLMGPMQNSSVLKDLLTRVAAAVNAEHAGKASVFELSKQGARGFGADYHPSKAQAEINGSELTKYLSGLMNWPVQAGGER
jgi:lysophospholipase L1-like esterase